MRKLQFIAIALISTAMISCSSGGRSVSFTACDQIYREIVYLISTVTAASIWTDGAAADTTTIQLGPATADISVREERIVETGELEVGTAYVDLEIPFSWTQEGQALGIIIPSGDMASEIPPCTGGSNSAVEAGDGVTIISSSCESEGNSFTISANYQFGAHEGRILLEGTWELTVAEIASASTRCSVSWTLGGDGMEVSCDNGYRFSMGSQGTIPIECQPTSNPYVIDMATFPVTPESN